jgi:hypothetical protein
MTRSIQQLPNNSGSTSVTEVYTATGFNAGDPVYFQNGDYKNPANLPAPSSVSFNFNYQAPYNPNGNGGSISPMFSFTQLQAGFGGGSNRKFTSLLTNGNFVQVWINHANATANANCPYFRIVNSSGTVVVSPTVISTIYTASYSAISVVALTGGGFAVGWTNSAGGTSGCVNYAIYSNTGSVVTAATQDTTFTTSNSYCAIEMTALANGGFAIAARFTTNVIWFRAYGSTGTGAFAVTSSGLTASGANAAFSFGFTSRSDSSIFIVDRLSNTANQYALFSSAGATIVAATTFSLTGSFVLQCSPDASVLTDGTTIVIAYYNIASGTTAYPALRFLPTGNTLGSEIVGIPQANNSAQYSYSGNYIGVYVTTGNNIFLIWADSFGNMQYAVYNSSGTCISGSNSTGAIPNLIPGAFVPKSNRISFVESGGFVNAYWSSSSYQQQAIQQFSVKINLTTYQIVPITSTTITASTVTGQPVGALVQSSVNPNGVGYYTTSSSSSVVTNTPTTISGSTVINSASCDSIASCSLPNGGFVIAYKTTSGNVVSANVYSSSNSLIITVAVASSALSSSVFAVKVCALSGGGFVVAYATSSTVITVKLYSSAYALSGTTTITQYSFTTNYQFDICGLQGDNFAIVFSNDGTNGAVRVYNSALSNIYSLGFSGTPTGFSIAGNSFGGFALAYFSGGQGYFRTFVPISTSSWAPVTVGNWSTGAYVQDPQLCATQSGAYVVTSYTSGAPSYGMFNDSGPNDVLYTGALSSWPPGSGAGDPTSYPMMGIGLTGNGNIVIATSYSGTALGIIGGLSAQFTFSTGQTIPWQLSSVSYGVVPLFSNNTYSIATIVTGLASQPRVTPLTGNNCLITFKDTSNYPAFIVVSGSSSSTAYSVVAGTTVSSLVPVASISNSSTVGIAGVFAGVALTTASAGSTGQVAINGQALLGSSYTSTATGAFDSTGNAVSGVKGTFNGRSVNLQGNT